MIQYHMIVTIDVVLLTLRGKHLQVVLLKRARDPFKGRFALPGAYIRPEQDADALDAAHRMLLQKTGITSPYLEQLYTFSGDSRDPRGWSISITHYALLDSDTLMKNAKEGVVLMPIDALPGLPFDHNRIIEAAANRLRDKSSYSTLPCYLLPKEFTLAELQKTYEVVLGVRLDKSQFRRRVAEWNFIEEISGSVKGGTHRPAQLYRVGTSRSLELFDRSV